MTVIEGICNSGKLGRRVGSRFSAALKLIALHKRGWLDPADGRANPLSGDDAREARNMLELIEHEIGPDYWPIIARVVLGDLEVEDCYDLFSTITNGRRDTMILNGLCKGLDIIAPKIGLWEKEHYTCKI